MPNNESKRFKVGDSFRPKVIILAVNKKGIPIRIRVVGREYQLDDNHYIEEPLLNTHG